MADLLRPTGPASDQSAGLMKAMGQLADAVSPGDSAGMFGQVKKITINNSLILSNTAGYDIDFEVPFDDDPEINESVITVYNLSQNTLGQIKKDMPITIEAGYEKDSSGQILSGLITGIRSYWDDLDYITEIRANDCQSTKDQELQDISFPANTSGSQILRDLVNRIGIPVVIFEVKRDHVFENPVKVSGSLMDGIRKYAQVCGVSAWVSRSNLYVCPLSAPVTDWYFDLKSDTGLLSVEEWQEEETLEQSEAERTAGEPAKTETINGVTVKMLLQHRLYTGCTIQVTSRNVNGRFKVREGVHNADDDDFTTTAKAIRME